jgi:hypothetical protein
MRAMRLRKSRHQRAHARLGKPFGQAAFQDALPAAANAGHYDNCQRAAIVRGAQKARERGSSRILVMAV